MLMNFVQKSVQYWELSTFFGFGARRLFCGLARSRLRQKTMVDDKDTEKKEPVNTEGESKQ
jgi:hypothetical protein